MLNLYANTRFIFLFVLFFSVLIEKEAVGDNIPVIENYYNELYKNHSAYFDIEIVIRAKLPVDNPADLSVLKTDNHIIDEFTQGVSDTVDYVYNSSKYNVSLYGNFSDLSVDFISKFVQEKIIFRTLCNFVNKFNNCYVNTTNTEVNKTEVSKKIDDNDYKQSNLRFVNTVLLFSRYMDWAGLYYNFSVIKETKTSVFLLGKLKPEYEDYKIFDLKLPFKVYIDFDNNINLPTKINMTDRAGNDIMSISSIKNIKISNIYCYDIMQLVMGNSVITFKYKNIILGLPLDQNSLFSITMDDKNELYKMVNN